VDNLFTNDPSVTNTLLDASNTIKALTSWSNTIFAGDGKDTIIGNKGNDTIIGGKGNDTIGGGFGTDTFVFGVNLAQNGLDYVDALPGAIRESGEGLKTDGDILNFGMFFGGYDYNPAAPSDLQDVFTSNVEKIVISEGDVIRLVDIARGENILTESGLSKALNDAAGEYSNINMFGNKAIIITANTKADGDGFKDANNYVFLATKVGGSIAVELVGITDKVDISAWTSDNFLV